MGAEVARYLRVTASCLARPMDLTGDVFDRDKFTDMLKECYHLRGWDEKSGLSTKETLVSLGMEDMAK